MRHLVLIFLFLFTVSGGAQQYSFKTWEADAKKDKRMLPEYGNKKKTNSEIEADNRFVNSLLESGKSKNESAYEMIRLGFEYIYKGDLKTAMYRFNQAFLLNPKNSGAYWGYGSVYMALGQYQLARKQYDQGLKLEPNSAPILTDYATTYLGEYYDQVGRNNKKASEKLELTQQKLIASYNIDPEYISTAYKLSIVYLNKGDCVNAKTYLNKTRALGGQPITRSYLSDFNLRCANCTSVKTGQFEMENAEIGTTTIKRTNKFQIEENKKLNYKLKLKVEWLDDCTYTLLPISDYTDNNEVPKEKLTCQIIEVSKDEYIQVSTVGNNEKPLTSKVKIIR